MDYFPDFGMIIGALIFGSLGFLLGSLLRRLEEKRRPQ
jgi:hypothetical protein